MPLLSPVKDVSHEPIVLALPKVSGKIAVEQCLNLRCTESNCQEPPVAPPTMPEGVPQTVRRVRIRGHHVRTHGATRGCEGCMAAMRGENARDHTEPCRNRFMQVFESTPQGRVRIEMMQERTMETRRNSEDHHLGNISSVGDIMLIV